MKNNSNEILYSNRTYLDSFSLNTTGTHYAIKKELIYDSNGNLKHQEQFLNKNQFKSNIYYNHNNFQTFTLQNTDLYLSPNLSLTRHLIKESDISNFLSLTLSSDKLEKLNDRNGNPVDITVNLESGNLDVSNSISTYYYLDSAPVIDGSNLIFNNIKIPRTTSSYDFSLFKYPDTSLLNDVVVKYSQESPFTPNKVVINRTDQEDINYFVLSILGDLISSNQSTKKIIYNSLLALGNDVLNSGISNRNLQLSTFKTIRKNIYDEFLERIFKESRIYDNLKFSFSLGDGKDEYFLINLVDGNTTIDINSVSTFSFTFTDSTIVKDSTDGQIRFYSEGSLLSETHSNSNTYIAIKKSTIYNLQDETILNPSHYLLNQTVQITLTQTDGVFNDIFLNQDGTYKKFSITSSTLSNEFSSYSYHNALIYHLIDMGNFNGLPERSKILNNYFKFIFDEYYTIDGVNNEEFYNKKLIQQVLD